MAAAVCSTPSLSPATVHPLQGNTRQQGVVLDKLSALPTYHLPNTFYTQQPSHSKQPSPPHFSLSGKTKVIVHAVDKSDTLQGLALLYGVQVSDIRAANHLWPHESIKSTGRKDIYIPFELCTRFQLTDGGEQPQKLTHLEPVEPAHDVDRRSYGAVLEAAFAFYNLVDARERWANPPVENTSRSTSSIGSIGSWSSSTVSPRYSSSSSTVRDSVSSGTSVYEGAFDVEGTEQSFDKVGTVDPVDRNFVKRKTVELDTIDANCLSYFPSPPAVTKVVLPEDILPVRPAAAHLATGGSGTLPHSNSARSMNSRSNSGGSLLKVLMAAVSSNRNVVSPTASGKKNGPRVNLKGADMEAIELQG